MKPAVFVDTDVIISSVISSRGASRMLIDSLEVVKTISNISLVEIKKVSQRLQLSDKSLQATLVKCECVSIDANNSRSKTRFGKYVVDEDDAHIVAGVVEAKLGILVTFNQKDFKREFLKRDFEIIILSPGEMLQYLRGKNTI